LLRLAEQEFDAFLTNDQNLEHQQNLQKFDLAIVVLVAPTNDIEDLKPLMPDANAALNNISAGEIVYIKAPSI
jgi:tryptophan synthase alpha subunit